jgi:nicotinamidase-related amidase
MKMNKTDFLASSNKSLGEIFDLLAKASAVQLKDLPPKRTALVMLDVINAFTREGTLKSPRIERIIPEIVKLSRKCDELKIAKLAFADNHNPASPEFEAYGAHAIAGTHESEIVDELKEVGGYILVPKNSTDSFLEEGFQKWFRENPKIDTYIVTGDCTDICIQQFAVAIKSWFNMQNKKSRIIVPVNAVETYDLGMHEANLMHVMALYFMMINGIEIVKEVR